MGGGFQSYLVQEVGQNITADIRYDLFTHVTSLAVALFLTAPQVGKLITRLTSDVDALGDVFFPPERWALFTDLVSILVLLVVMFTMQWQLALMLLTLLLAGHLADYLLSTSSTAKANYKAREHLFGTQCLAAGKYCWHQCGSSCFGESGLMPKLFRENEPEVCWCR